MLGDIGFITHTLAAGAYVILALLLVFHRRARPVAPAMLVACLGTAGWACTIAVGTQMPYPPILALQIGELVRDLSWLFVLLLLLSLQSDGRPWHWRGVRWLPWIAATAAVGSALVLLRALPEGAVPLRKGQQYDIMLAAWLCFSIAGLLLVEQLFRNASEQERWALKFLCLGLGALMIYDFFMYAEALLFRQLNPQLWQARGLVAAVATPWIAIAIGRTPTWQVELHVSRHVVFHTVTLMGAGIYLLGMATAGYFIQYFGGSWGGVLQLGFFAAAIALLVSLLFSGSLRARLRVYLSKHFFSYRYDYREQWLNFTHALAELGDDLGYGLIRVMAALVGSHSGLLYARHGEETSRPLAEWKMPLLPLSPGELDALEQWLEATGWVIDLREYHREPDLYRQLTLPEALVAREDIWLILPLMFRERVEGVLVLGPSDVEHTLNWENRDLLKTAGRQAASHLAQHLANQALVESRQFEAFNRLSAYVVHDLKNILAQQSLMVRNAEKHKRNPEFVDDMVKTVRNSVDRMQRLMEQMRSGERTARASTVSLREVLEAVVAARASGDPAPSLCVAGDCEIDGDRERLATVFTHLVQNAQEATDSGGSVTVRLERLSPATPNAPAEAVVTVADTGAGMDEQFVRERLFKPFESTKGLTGMGIGAFESREYVRQLGGRVEVRSTPGEGTEFLVVLPVAP